MSAGATVAATLRKASAGLPHSSSSRLDAELLLAHVLECDRTALYRAPERLLSTAEQAAFERLLTARAAGRPVAQLTGTTEFWSVRLAVNDDVLVPRAETELLVDCALELSTTHSAPIILDAGTGSGAIARALVEQRPHARILASDRYPRAAALAGRNLAGTGVPVFIADWLEACAASIFDLVIANPPYIAYSERPGLPPELAFEPDTALFAEGDGLEALERLAESALRVLQPGGHLLLEHGHRQGAAVRALLDHHGYDHIETRRDGAGHERVAIGRRPAFSRGHQPATRAG